MKASLGKAIRLYRLKQDYTLQDLADKSGLSVSYLSHLENDGRNPRYSTVVAIAHALGVQVYVLVGLATGFIDLSPIQTEDTRLTTTEHQKGSSGLWTS